MSTHTDCDAALIRASKEQQSAHRASTQPALLAAAKFVLSFDEGDDRGIHYRDFTRCCKELRAAIAAAEPILIE